MWIKKTENNLDLYYFDVLSVLIQTVLI